MVGLHLSAPVSTICLNIERCLKFEAKTTVTVNQEADDPSTFLVIFIVTIIVNSVSAVIVGRQETTGINTMIICDCLVNVINMGTYSLNMSSWRLLGSGSDQLCTVSLFFRVILTTWNHLVPVAIATQRYLLVCRAVACHSFGGGKRIWTFIHSTVVFLCILCGVVFALERSSSLTFLRCMGEEEKFWYVGLLQNCLGSLSSPFNFFFFRYNLENFYSPPLSTSGMELRQPIWAPARVLTNLTTWAFIFLVPLLYRTIFKFRNIHNLNMKGKYSVIFASTAL